MALILIAEDASLTRALIRKALQTEGHEVLEASSGYQCLEMVTIHAPDCLILDLLMPQMNGYEVLSALRDQNSKIPAIVVTADIQETSRRKCLELGAIAVITKPARQDELLTVVQNALNFPEDSTL